MFPTPSDQGPLLWRRFIVVRIDRVDMLVRDDETPEPFVKRFPRYVFIERDRSMPFGQAAPRCT